jgi:hypothetical protein
MRESKFIRNCSEITCADGAAYEDLDEQYAQVIYRQFLTAKEDDNMFLGLEWYWWLVILAVLAVLLPVKVKFMKWWSRRTGEKKNSRRGKWGDEE